MKSYRITTFHSPEPRVEIEEIEIRKRLLEKVVVTNFKVDVRLVRVYTEVGSLPGLGLDERTDKLSRRIQSIGRVF